MAGGGYKPGFHPHLPGFTHNFLAKSIGATMWFFIFYRMRKEFSSKVMGQHSFMLPGHDDAHTEHH